MVSDIHINHLLVQQNDDTAPLHSILHNSTTSFPLHLIYILCPALSQQLMQLLEYANHSATGLLACLPDMSNTLSVKNPAIAGSQPLLSKHS
jgi:hypothetical protein